MQAPNPTDLESAQAAQEEAEREAAKRREQEVADFEWVMDDARGRRFVWRLMKEGGAFRSSFSDNALHMAFREGQRDQAMKLIDEVLKICPGHWLNMIKEQNAK